MQYQVCFVLSYLLVTSVLSRATQENKLLGLIPKYCSQLKLRSLFLKIFKHDICSGEDGKKESDFKKYDAENVFQQYVKDDPDTNIAAKNDYINSSISQNTSDIIMSRNEEQTSRLNTFYQSLEKFERNLYWTTFSKLATIGGVEQQENGMSFVQSGLFLFMSLLAISVQMDEVTRNNIHKTMEYRLNDTDITAALQEVTSWLPKSSDSFKFLSVMRLVLKDGLGVKSIVKPAEAMELKINSVNSAKSHELTSVLNDMVSNDSGGSMKNTFEEEELVNGICAVLLMTAYVRPRWRASPVVLNGTSEFHDADNPKKLIRMIRINDIMLYANLDDLDAEAVQIQYESPDLALLVLVPRGNSLRRLGSRVSSASLTEIYRRMQNMRVAVTLPLYTLRMTLLLQNKLEQMGITKLFIPKTSNASDCEHFMLSHAVQRIMFWSEAGRHAFKDDGMQWDPTPQKEVIVNRPYLFYVRWKNVTLVNGNFVL